jgi:hypothetical protein
MPWPFGLICINYSRIRVSSWHWSWWIRDQTVPRASIQAIERSSVKPGATRFVVQRDDTDPVTINASGADGDLLAREFQLHGYVVHLSQ